MNKSFTKYIAGGVIIAAFIVYLVLSHQNSAATIPPALSPVAGGTNGSGTGAGSYKDGTYTGPVTDAFYGNIQVAVVIQGGKLTDVQFLQYPQAPGHSSEVSAMALPALKQEAIAAQNAQVNVVSGATQDSQAFQQSLAAALAQASS